VIFLRGKLGKPFKKVKNEFFQQAICQLAKSHIWGEKTLGQSGILHKKV
jgi:hypothetical protein